MLSKPTGNSTIVALAANTTGTTTVTTFSGAAAKKVRIVTHGQPAAVTFTSTVAVVATGILVPADSAEHFSLENTSRVSWIQVGSGTGGFISITPVA